MKNKLIVLLALLLVVSGTPVAYACSVDSDYVAPTDEEKFNSGADVVVASIVSSNISKESYDESYEPNPEIVTFKVEKVYKGDLLIGDTFSITRDHGDGTDCLPLPLFRHLEDDLDGSSKFYNTYQTPSFLVYLNEDFQDGAKLHYSLDAERVAREGEKLSLVDVIEYSDTILADVAPDISESPEIPTDTTQAERVAALQAQIDKLTRIVELLVQLLALQKA